MDRQTDGQMDRQTDGKRDKQIYRHMERDTDGQTDRWKKQINRQTDI